MADVSLAIQPKSDQLNYDDVSGGRELIIMITGVNVTNSDQPVSIFYEGCDKKTYKPSKGMTRLLADAWGTESDNWIGKSVCLYGDSTAKWAGKEIGGIRIKALSDIPTAGIKPFVTIAKGRRRQTFIEFLNVAPPKPTADDQTWIDAAKADIKVLEQITDTNYRTHIQSFL